MGAGALETARELGDAGADRDRGGGARPRRGRPRARSRPPASTTPRRWRCSTGSPTRSSPPSLDAFYYLAWVENYLERYDEALAHVDRAIGIARWAGEGRLLIPLMLTKGYPLELQGRLAEAAEICEAAVEAARLSGNRHYLFWALFELGLAALLRRRPRRRDRGLRGEPALRRPADRRHDPLRRRRTGLGAGGRPLHLRRDRAGAGDDAGAGQRGDRVRGPGRALLRLGDASRWPSSTTGDVEAAEGYAQRAEELAAAALDLQLPPALAAQDPRGDPARTRARPRRRSPRRGLASTGTAAAGARLQAAFSRSLLGQALAAAGEREEAIAELREAERELDACGSCASATRSAASCASSAPAARRAARRPGRPGIDSLTKRELEIADLVTDRKTNKEIAAELFLSEKTIESHLRNIFFKLGVSSRVEVARAVERERASSRRPA